MLYIVCAYACMWEYRIKMKLDYSYDYEIYK